MQATSAPNKTRDQVTCAILMWGLVGCKGKCAGPSRPIAVSTPRPSGCDRRVGCVPIRARPPPVLDATKAASPAGGMSLWARSPGEGSAAQQLVGRDAGHAIFSLCPWRRLRSLWRRCAAFARCVDALVLAPGAVTSAQNRWRGARHGYRRGSRWAAARRWYSRIRARRRRRCGRTPGGPRVGGHFEALMRAPCLDMELRHAVARSRTRVRYRDLCTG